MDAPHPLLTPRALGVTLALCLCASSAEAQPVEQARAAFEQGVGLARRSRWLEAAEAFRRSQALADRASTAFNLALALQQLGRVLEARAVLTSCLAMPDAAGDEALRRDAQRVLATVQSQVATLALTVSPADATARLDGDARPERGVDREIELDPGRHAVRVEREGAEPEEFSVTLQAGERTSRRVTLAESPARIAVAPWDPRATVSVDDVALGRGAVQWRGRAGVHRVRVELAGYRAVSRAVRVEAGARVEVPVTLLRESTPLAQNPWFWSMLGAGTTAVTAVLVWWFVRIPDAPSGGTTGQVVQGLAVRW